MSKKEYKNKTTLNRVRASKINPKKSFVIEIYKNKGLNFIDIGLLTWLLSNSKTYIVNKKNVMKRSGIPEGKFKDSWKKLEKLGFIEKEDIQGGVHWIINEIPVTCEVS